MEKTNKYPRVEFSPKALLRIVSELKDIVEKPVEAEFRSLSIEKDSVTWRYDTFEEFLAELSSDITYGRLLLSHTDLSVAITMWPAGSMATTVGISSSTRESILRLSNVIDSCANDCFVPPPPEPEKAPLPKPNIFIGHGGSPQWRDLKDHLHEHHGYEIIAYETGSRAGHTIRDVLDDMLSKSSFAILVMTGEDDMEDGSFRARQNVIHETGLFQGRLGFSKAVVLKEDQTEEFSNIHGVQQIRYSKGNIKETFGDVLAVLKREFE